MFKKKDILSMKPGLSGRTPEMRGVYLQFADREACLARLKFVISRCPSRKNLRVRARDTLESGISDFLSLISPKYTEILE